MQQLAFFKSQVAKLVLKLQSWSADVQILTSDVNFAAAC